MILSISIRYEPVTVEEAQTIYAFLKENAGPYPGMEIHARIIQNEPPYTVPEPEPP